MNSKMNNKNHSFWLLHFCILIFLWYKQRFLLFIYVQCWNVWCASFLGGFSILFLLFFVLQNMFNVFYKLIIIPIKLHGCDVQHNYIQSWKQQAFQLYLSICTTPRMTRLYWNWRKHSERWQYRCFEVVPLNQTVT